MTGCSTSSSPWMLPVLLLLLLLISVQQSSCGPLHCGLSEFNKRVDSFGNFVENCSKGSSTNRSCQYNVTVSQGGCTIDGFFIQGLSSLESNMNVKHLIKKLRHINTHCKQLFTELSLECGGDVMSLETFNEKLKHLKQILNNNFAAVKK